VNSNSNFFLYYFTTFSRTILPFEKIFLFKFNMFDFIIIIKLFQKTFSERMSCQPRKNIFHYKNLKNIPTTNFAKHSHLFLLYLFLKTLKKFKQQNFSNLEPFYQSGISRTYLSRQPIALSATLFKNLTKTKFEKSCKPFLTKIYKNLKNFSFHQRELRRIVSPCAKTYHKFSQNFSQSPQNFQNLIQNYTEST